MRTSIKINITDNSDVRRGEASLQGETSVRAGRTMHTNQPPPQLGAQLTLLRAQTHLETVPSAQLGARSAPASLRPSSPSTDFTDFKVYSESRGILRTPAPYAQFLSCILAPELRDRPPPACRPGGGSLREGVPRQPQR